MMESEVSWVPVLLPALLLLLCQLSSASRPSPVTVLAAPAGLAAADTAPTPASSSNTTTTTTTTPPPPPPSPPHATTPPDVLEDASLSVVSGTE